MNSEWIPVVTPPKHGQKVKTKDTIGRKFDCTYYHWSNDLKPYFQVNGTVWDHSNVIEWKPYLEPPK